MEELRPAEGPQAIEAYGAGSFTIAGRRHQGSILVLVVLFFFKFFGSRYLKGTYLI